MSIPESQKKLMRERVARGQCPRCGKEAAPYYLCAKHRQEARFTRALNRGAKVGFLTKEKQGRKIYFNLGDQTVTTKWGSTPVEGVPDTDKRSRPRLRGLRVDVEGTLVAILRHIGRPSTLEEIQCAWGKLRDNRASPLPVDLANIIVAEDRRAARNAKRAAIAQRQEQGAAL